MFHTLPIQQVQAGLNRNNASTPNPLRQLAQAGKWVAKTTKSIYKHLPTVFVNSVAFFTSVQPKPQSYRASLENNE